MAVTETKIENAQTYAILRNATTVETFLLETSSTWTQSTGTSISTDTVNGDLSTVTLYGAVPVTLSVSVSGFQSAPTTTPTTTSSTSSSSSSLSTSSTISTPIVTPPTSSVSSTAGSGAATTNSPVPNPTPKGKSNVGAYVGAAIGGLVVGALIAGIIAFFIMSRRQKKHRSSGGDYGRGRNHSSHPSNEKALPSAPLLGGGVVGNWEKHLDQPESDNTITRSVKGLFDHIEMHVENFYRDAPIPITPDLSASLMSLKSSRDLPDEPAGLLSQTDRPTLLIKHCIAYAVVEHIDHESGVSDSFLPADFTALPMALMTRSRSTSGKPAYHQAYSRWRVISSYLRPKPAEDPSYMHMRDAHITALADQLCRTFDPWALSRDNFAGRRQNLVDIMKVGAGTGVLLFSQPGTFRWRWGRRDGGAGKSGMPGKVTVVVLPGVEKVRDEEARELERAVVLVRAVEGVLAG